MIEFITRMLEARKKSNQFNEYLRTNYPEGLHRFINNRIVTIYRSDWNIYGDIWVYGIDSYTGDSFLNEDGFNYRLSDIPNLNLEELD